MSGDLSLWGAQHFSQVVFGQYQNPLTNYYLALITGADPSGFITGAEIDEVSGGGYSRYTLPNNTSTWHEQDLGRMANSNAFSFPTATADWGRIRSWALCSAATGGEIVFYGQFKAAKTISTGDTFWIDNGAISIEFMAGA